jgi:tetratricopeptide (TPR) repeat protein
MKNTFESMITLGDFQEAKKIFLQMNSSETRDSLLKIGYDTESIAPYSFLCGLLIESESSELHYMASELLSNPLCFLAGAYNAALYHARRAAELSPNDISYKEYILLFYNIPEKLIPKEEAICIATEILSVNPNSIVAKDVLSNK